MSITGSLFLNETDRGSFAIGIKPDYQYYQFPRGFPTIQTGSGPSPEPSIPTVGQLWPRGNRQ